jgi:predicted enzyme related to lactoylglutathione lyase
LEPLLITGPGTPAHWLAYFAVSDCDKTAAEAKRLGAEFYVPPTDFENVGRISVIADPQSAAFANVREAGWCRSPLTPE